MAPFSVSHVIAIDSCSLLSLSFFLFLDVIAISNCVFNNKNNYSTRTCRISNNYASRWLSIPHPARPRCTQICVYPRAFVTLRVAQFSLKIAHLSFSMGPRGPCDYGLRPRLWQKYIKKYIKNFSLNELRVPKNRIKFHTFRAQPFFSGKSRFQLKNAVLRHIKQI